MEHVEEERRQRERLASGGYVELGPETPHRLLERKRPPVRTERKDLTVEDRSLQRKRRDGLYDLRHPVGDVPEVPGHDQDGVPGLVDLDRAPRRA